MRRTLRLERLPPGRLAPSALQRAVLAGRVKVPGLPVARHLEDVPRPVDRLDGDDRASLAEGLEAALATLEPRVAVIDALRSLAEPGAACVVTGQQPGFLASPLYSLYKALQAIRLAALLRERWGSPVVALFWNHADDHDIAEVQHAHFVNPNLDLQRVGLAGLSSGRRPISRIALTEVHQRLSAVHALLEQTFHGEPHVERALELFVPRDGETLARAFTRAFTDLLGHLGLVVVEPDWIRAPLSRALADVVGRDPMPALRRGAEELRAARLDVPIDPETAALVYRVDERGRHALRSGGDGFRYDDEPGSRTPAELAAEIVQEPEAWSAGALLRPIVQDLALPVCAYVGGWGELGYHLELGALREERGGPRTPFVARLSCTLVDEESRVALTKVGAEVHDVLARSGALDEDDADGPPVAARLRAVADQAAQELLGLRGELDELDRSLSVNAKKTADQMRSLVDKLAAKAERVHQNRSGKGRRHLRRLANQLLPRDELQERVLGPLPYVARFGTDWIDDLVADLDPFAVEHIVVHLLPATDGAEETGDDTGTEGTA